jgi:saccharopine dehydrogenase (NAD+, L-lysine-forming)
MLANAHNAGGPVSGARDGDWVLFGATGVTGRMVLAKALAAGHRPRLAGRPSRGAAELAERHGLTLAAAHLDDANGLSEALRGARLVLNAAGPFAITAPRLVRAALKSGCDYLDLNGELGPLVGLLAQGERAREAGVALVGGCGFGAAASDGPARMVAERLGGLDSLRLSVAADSAHASPAVAESTLAVLAGGGFEVAGGRLVARRLAALRWDTPEPLGGGRQAFASAPLADLAAALHATGAPRIVAGVPMAPLQARALSLAAPVLPSLLTLSPIRRALARTGGHAGNAEAAADRCSWVLAEGRKGARRAMTLLKAGEGFAAAADIALAAVETALARRPEPGAHSPATAFGPAFVTRVPGMHLEHLDA